MTKYKQLQSGILVQCSDKDYLADGLTNVASGLGMAKSKRAHNRWGYGSIGDDWSQLDACYRENWIARAIIDEWAADAVREWRTIKSDGAEDIEAVEMDLDVAQATEDAISWSRLYGGAGVVMLTNQDLEKPLDLSKIKKGDLERLEVFDRYDLTPYGNINTYDMLARNYLRPDFFTISNGSQRIHHSHIAFFNGARLPKRQARMNFGWGDSELRRAITEISDMVAAKDGVAELLQEVNIDIITRDGLTDELTTDQDDAIIKRYELFSQMKSVVNMALLDGQEKLDRQTLQLGGVSQILETMMVWISGAARMPVTKVFGKAASGLNATGEYDSKNYFDAIRGKQQGDISKSMRQIDEVLVRSALGYWPDSFDWVWNPLAQLNGVEVAQEQLLQAQKNQIYLQNNIINRSQIMRNLQSNEEYQFDDDELGRLEVLEDGNLFDEVETEPEETGSAAELIDSKINNGFASVKLDRVTANYISQHLDSIGISNAIKPDDMHLTLMYSRDSEINTSPNPEKEYKGKVIGDPAIIGNDPWRALVVKIDSDELRNRHNELKLAGGVHSYPEFLPHLSLKYSPDDGDLARLKESMINGVLVFSGESFKPIKE